MENFDEKQPFASENEDITLVVTEEARGYIYQTAKWTKFLAIIGFLLSAFMILAAFIIPSVFAALSAFPRGEAVAKIGTGFATFSLLLYALIYFYPSLMLYKYSNAAKEATLFGDQASLTKAMSKMKSFFKFWGILIIISIAFTVFIFIYAILLGIGSGM